MKPAEENELTRYEATNQAVQSAFADTQNQHMWESRGGLYAQRPIIQNITCIFAAKHHITIRQCRSGIIGAGE